MASFVLVFSLALELKQGHVPVQATPGLSMVFPVPFPSLTPVLPQYLFCMA